MEALQRARAVASLNAFVTLVDPPHSGSSREPGPLAGVPFAAKDNIDTAGIRTTCGSHHFADRVPTSDADCIARLLDAGATLIGKTLTHEFAYGPTGDSSATGPAHHPTDPGRITGGSSAGSAAAVAAGVVPFALGTDTGGSSRIPAALCGVLGFKPTYGALSTAGAFPLSPTLDTIGILAASSDWLSRVWAALTRTAAVPHDPGSIAWVSFTDDAPVDPRVGSAVAAWGADAITGSVRLPSTARFTAIYQAIQGWEASQVHADLLAGSPQLYQSDVRERLLDASHVTASSYRRALTQRDQLRLELGEVFDSVGFLALPTCPITAPPLGVEQVVVQGRLIPVREALLSLTNPWSVLGWPALSIPAGTVDGLPVGIQLVGPPGSDAHLISIAHTLINRHAPKESS